MKKIYSYTGVVGIVLAMTAILLFKSNAQPSTNPPPLPPGFANQSDYLQSLTNEAAISAAYQGGHISKDEAGQMVSNRVASLPYRDAASIQNAYNHGLIGKGEAMILDSMRKNGQEQNLYGRVVDQNGQPVAGVVVEGCLEILNGWTVGKVERPTNQTDANGLFQFTGLKGANLSASVSKAGYEIDYRVGQIAPVGGQSSSNDRMTFIMCKLHGAEPMIHADTKGLPYWYSLLKPNEEAARINLMTCRDAKYVSEKYITGERHYDLEVGLHRDELIKTNANRVLFCNWSATIGIKNGGLVAIPTNAIYPYEAPAEGYQPSLTLDFPTNMAGWTDQFKKSFYFKSENGKTYGRMTIEMNNRGRLALEIYANPNGSRNLEFDPQKQIR